MWLDFFTVNIFLRLTLKILSFLRLTAKFLAVLRLTVKILSFLRLTAKFLAVLWLTVNPVETLFIYYKNYITTAAENLNVQMFSCYVATLCFYGGKKIKDSSP